MMESRFERLMTTFLAAAVLVAGCASPSAVNPAEPPQFALPISEGLKALAEPATHQWSTGLITSEAIQRLAAERRTAAPDRGLLSVTNNWSQPMSGFGAAATGRISSAPSYHYYTKVCYWLTETGWLLKYNTKTGATSAVKIAGSDTFPNTAITLNSYGTRAYFVSAEGNFHAIDTATGAHIQAKDAVSQAPVTTPISMGGTHASVPFGTAPFIDPLASRPDGTLDTVYAVSATGVLNRFVCSSSGTILAQSYTLPVANGTHTELCRSAPVVLNGRAVITTWRRHNTAPYNSANDEGAVMYYDTGARTTSTAATSGSSLRRVVLSAPIWAPAAVDVDNALVPTLAFFPAGPGAVMLDLTTGLYAQSVPLVVDSTATASGALSSYAYGTAGTSTITKYPSANGAAMIYGNGTVGTTAMYAAKQMTSANASQIYGYMKYNLTEAELTASNVQKVITNATLTLRCNGSSNPLGIYALQSPRLFRTHNQIASGAGASWDSTNLAFGTRPPHMDGVAFDQTLANLSARSSWELSRTGTPIFLTGADYTWSAKGQIGLPNNDYTLGMVHTQLLETPTLLGALLSVPAPRFVGGTAAATSPKLTLTVSQAGFANPTLSAPVSIDAVNKQIFVANTNALFKVSYASTLNTWLDRAASFADDTKTHFALTNLGANASASPTHTAGTRFVENTCAPLYDGRYVYIQDNHPGYLRTSISRFTPGANGVAPSLSASLLLSDAGADARATPPYMSYDYESNRLMVATYSPSAAQGRAWVLNRF